MTSLTLFLISTLACGSVLSLAGLEAPKYTVVKKMSTFEIRKYPPMRMAYAQEKDVDLFEGKIKTFMKLYRYMSGGNDRKQLLNLTFPLIDEIRFGEKCQNIQHFAKYYYIPSVHQGDPPIPNLQQDDVSVRFVEGRTMYARSFTGWSTRPRILQNVKDLQDDLQKEKMEVDSSQIFVAELSPTWEILNRTNEVLLKSKSGLTRHIVH